MVIVIVQKVCLLTMFRVNTFTVITPQAPFGGYKMSGQGREL